MRLAAGEFVQFLDGDDCLAPDKVEKQVAVFNAAPEVDVVYGDARQFQSAAGFSILGRLGQSGLPRYVGYSFVTSRGTERACIPDSLIFRRRSLELVGPWEENPPNH